MRVQSVSVFIQGKARRCAWPPPAKRSSNGRRFRRRCHGWKRACYE